MAKNVRFISTTKEKWLKRETYDSFALYFCEDTGEIFKGSTLLTDGIRIVPTRVDLPECSCAADGVVYFIAETKSGFMVSPDRTEWFQTIYAPVTNAYSIPEEEMYTTVTTVGAVRDIEAQIYGYIEEKFNNITPSGVGNLKPVDGTIVIADIENGGKSVGVAISTIENNILQVKEDGLFADIKVADDSHGLVAVDGSLTLNLATTTSDGAMSKEDKTFIDALRALNISGEYATKDEVQSVRESVAQVEQSYVWLEM